MGISERRRLALDEITGAAISEDEIASVAIFLVPAGDGPGPASERESELQPELRLAAAAGIAGPPLEGLVAAVRDPRHPIRRSLRDAGPTWDVAPLNPGGPVLRSHLPLRSRDASTDAPALGVLALAHEVALTAGARRRLEGLARQAAIVIASSTEPEKEIR